MKNINGASHPSNFGIFSARSKSFSVRIGDHRWNLVISLWPRNKATINRVRHSGSPRPAPKNSEYKNPLEKFSPQFFGIKTASSSLIIFPRAKLSTQSITHLCWCNWSTFEGKILREGHQGGLVLAQQCPGSLGTCNPEETGLPGLQMSWSPTLFPDLAPSDNHLFPGLKKQLKGRHSSSNAEVIAATETWLDGQPSDFFLSGLQKLE